MVSHDDIPVDALGRAPCDDILLHVLERHVVDILPAVGEIPKLEDLGNAVLLKRREECVVEKPLEVIDEFLVIVSGSPMEVTQQC